MTDPTVFAVFDKRCGHPLGCGGDRATAQQLAELVLGDYARHVGVREATDDDLIHLLQGVRCAACTVDGREVARG